MRQTLHLLVVDRDRGAALAAWHGSRWFLPILTCAGRVRAAPAVLRWVTERGVTGEVVGQWLGRVAPDATDWLMVISASPSSASVHGLAWTPLNTLASAPPLIDYQGWALAKSFERDSLPSVPGPFGNLTWLDTVRAWIGAAAGAPASGPLTPYRLTAHEVVLGAETARGRVYFKGLTQERATEARLTRTLATIVPCAFARTIALEGRADGSVWWLAAACPGEPNVRPELVSRALARMQQRMMASGPVRRALRPADLGAALRWTGEVAGDLASAAAIEQHVRGVMNAEVPESWIPMDLDPTNVLVDDGGEVRFIDLDDSFLGPVPLAMAVFAKRCRDPSLYRAYQQAWSPPLDDVDWPGFEVAATVFEAWLGWQRLERNVHRGDLYGALELAETRIRDRLVRCLQGR